MDRKHIRQIKEALPDDLDIQPAKRGHYKIVRSNGSFVATVAGSPRDTDGCVKQAIRDARRYAT